MSGMCINGHGTCDECEILDTCWIISEDWRTMHQNRRKIRTLIKTISTETTIGEAELTSQIDYEMFRLAGEGLSCGDADKKIIEFLEAMR